RDLPPGDRIEIPGDNPTVVLIPEATHVLRCPRFTKVDRQPLGQAALAGRLGPEKGNAKRRLRHDAPHVPALRPARRASPTRPCPEKQCRDQWSVAGPSPSTRRPQPG